EYMDDPGQMDTSPRIKAEYVADLTFTSDNVISQRTSSKERDKLCFNAAKSTTAQLESAESRSDCGTPKIIESNHPDEGLETGSDVKDGDWVCQKSENCGSEAQTATLELSKVGSNRKHNFRSANEPSIVCSQLSDADHGERRNNSCYEHNSMSLNEENMNNKVDLLQVKLTTSMTCGVLPSCVKGKQLDYKEEMSEGREISSGENIFEGQESDLSRPNGEPS
ncbi:hypothetical protein KI387_032948, partial [Taxus chinensis]